MTDYLDTEISKRILGEMAPRMKILSSLLPKYVSELELSQQKATEVVGLGPEHIEISVADEVITIKGRRNIDPPKTEEVYHRRERWGGQFSKSISLPFRTESSKVEAKYIKGVLTITVPRAEADKPRKITISGE